MIIRAQRQARFETPEGTIVSLGSSDYLGLATSEHVRARLVKAVENYGTGLALGATMFSTPAHQELSERLAAFLGYEAVALMGSGMLANAAALVALSQTAAGVMVDEHGHPSLLQGAQLSGLEIEIYPHCAPEAEGPLRPGSIIASDGVFSTIGDLCDLGEVLPPQTRGDAILLLDDAHGVGALGVTGRGTCEVFDCVGAPAVQTGSFSKALGGAGGGYVAGSAALIEEIEQRSVAFTATTRIGVHTAVAALASLELIVAQPARLARLHHLAAHLRSCLDAAGIPHSTGASPISIIPVGAESDAQRISARVLEHGFFLPTLVPPVTPPGSARLRLIPSVDHEESDLEEAVEALASAWAAVEPGREPSESWQAAT